MTSKEKIKEKILKEKNMVKINELLKQFGDIDDDIVQHFREIGQSAWDNYYVRPNKKKN